MMLLGIPHRSLTSLNRSALTRFSRTISNVPLPKNNPAPHILNPHVYSSRTSTWRPFNPNAAKARLDPGSLLRLGSWNVDNAAPGRTNRASAVMDHLKEAFGDSPPPLVIMLQEVHHQALPAILEHSWIKENFVVSNAEAPYRYFTLMMVSQRIQAENWFRVPFESPMRRDALVVDIPVSSPKGEPEQAKRLLRLCTLYLELPEEGNSLRPGQLARISALLKAPPTDDAQVVGGLVGGDMYNATPFEATIHRVADIDLNYAWEDTAPPPAPKFEPSQGDLTFGRAAGHTWGYQPPGPRAKARLDKFLYTGHVEAAALDETRDLTGKVGRLGVDLKTKVKIRECDEAEFSVVNGTLMGTPRIEDYDTKVEEAGEAVKEVDAWVNDHFGIAVGIKVH